MEMIIIGMVKCLQKAFYMTYVPHILTFVHTGRPILYFSVSLIKEAGKVRVYTWEFKLIISIIYGRDH